MLKKSVAIIAVCTFLSACVTEPRDPDFAGAEGINKEAAAKNRVSLGLTYLSNGNFSQAKANLDKALNFAPKSADAHFAMAYYYQQVDELQTADEYYLEALNLAPENPNIINSYGAFLCEQGRYEKAKSYFLKAVTSKSYVSTAETYENLAICAVDQGKTDEAIGFFEQALNHQPTRGKSLFLLAQLQKDQGNFGEAKKTLWKYDRVSRVSSESLWLSYEIARGLGDTKSALGYGELMKSMYPEHPNTALFKQQMGKFQPVATVTSKRRAPAQQQEAATTSTSPQDSADSPSMIKVSKKSKVLAPADSTTEPVIESVTNAAADTQVVVENTQDSPVNEAADQTADKTDDKRILAITQSEAQKREADLEAALAAEFTADTSNSPTATIDGTATKVDNSLATADPVPALAKETVKELVQEPVKERVQEAASQKIDKAADENASYHIVLPKENLYRISLRYNVKMKFLMQWNNLDDPSDIKIGMKLRVKDPIKND